MTDEIQEIDLDLETLLASGDYIRAIIDVAGTPRSAVIAQSDLILENLRESGGDVLAMGAVADGEFLKRVGDDIVSAGAGAGADSIRTKYIITPSISTNDLVLAIKYIDGNDCTSTNKITFRVGDTEYDLTAAMSFTKAAATNWCNSGAAELATKNVQYFVYAIGETGASAGLKFGFSRIPYAKTMNDFVNTSTNEKYIAGNWTNFNTTDAVTNIGRFQAQLTATASFNWSIPTANVVNYPIYVTDLLTWSPFWTNLTTTSGTLVSTYKIIHTVLDYNIDFVFGASSAVGGDVSHSIPMAGVNFGNAKVAGTLGIKDTGTSQISGVNLMQSASLINYRALNAAGTYVTQVALSSTTPMTWTTTDEFHEWCTYSLV